MVTAGSGFVPLEEPDRTIDPKIVEQFVSCFVWIVFRYFCIADRSCPVQACKCWGAVPSAINRAASKNVKWSGPLLIPASIAENENGSGVVLLPAPIPTACAGECHGSDGSLEFRMRSNREALQQSSI